MPEDTKISKAQQKAVHKYVKNNYDRIELTVKPKGRKITLKEHAEKMGETLNAFINRAINETMERDGSGPAPAGSPVTAGQAGGPTAKDPRPSYLTPDILSHIDAKRFLSSDMGYQLQIGEIIGMGNLSSLAEYLKQNPPEPDNKE